MNKNTSCPYNVAELYEKQVQDISLSKT